MDIHNIPQEDKKQHLKDLRIIESGAVEEMYSQYKKSQKKKN